jgi:regulatory protein
MLITKIQRVRRERNRYIVYIDEQPVLRVSETTLVKAGLTAGGAIDQATIESLSGAERRETAYQIALNLVSYRPRSSKEILDKLARKGYEGELSREVVERLKDQRLLNDLEFARMFVRDRLKGKPMGRALLRKKLMEKGISFQLSERVLKEYVTEDNEETAAKALLTRKLKASFGRFSAMDAATRQRKLMEYLLRRGFSADIASKTARNVNR